MEVAKRVEKGIIQILCMASYAESDATLSVKLNSSLAGILP